ncbi:molybdenum cofactor biosynthesis protein MoaE [Paenibacillus endoradicis]|uniref:molybdenum cofactor biosynthesis protein MoaE n=1 Tax=Paenibacillus endoradicis TaxID=2972487 RepID=UPI002159615F|nr:molybdenum cofactor biosynthesis protein MoaE [Paenibacillus endoradicis]MCR8659014.1 molybdenum cofactor biosynthesis protein MoaE [Paenibacillus endoradicis]
MTYSWKFKLFAGLTERFGSSVIEVSLEQPSYTTLQLKKHLSEAFPQQAASLSVCYIAANMQYCIDEQIINYEQEIALLPPVSGGEHGDNIKLQNNAISKFEITNESINTESVMNKVITPAYGATLLFVGTTREFTGEMRTISLDYEAYEPMAIATMQQIGQEIAERWHGADCAITHRIGSVGLAEISVVIAVATAHRDDCYEASRYAIERLKQIVPIWKKEIWEDGSEWKGHQQGTWKPTVSLQQ